MTEKVMPGEVMTRLVLSLAARHVYSSGVFPNPCFSTSASVSTGPVVFISFWLWYQVKVAAGLEAAAHVRLKAEPFWMNSPTLDGVRVIFSGPSVEKKGDYHDFNPSLTSGLIQAQSRSERCRTKVG